MNVSNIWRHATNIFPCTHDPPTGLLFAFGEYKSKQVNVSGIQHYLAQI